MLVLCIISAYTRYILMDVTLTSISTWTNMDCNFFLPGTPTMDFLR